MSGVLLSAASITKSFNSVRALAGVSFDLKAGEVHALVGENGAGKSTLVRILTGAETADSGVITIRDTPIPRMDPSAAKALGIAAIYQQPTLFPDLSVAENIAMALETGGAWRRVNWPWRVRRTNEILDWMGTSIDPDRPANTLSMPEQQIVEIARAIGADASVLIMDEPTSSLAESEVEHLFGIIARLRERGVGIVYISHRLDEVFRVADRITVLRDGHTVATRPAADLPRENLIHLMVGHDLSAMFPQRRVTIDEVALEIRHLSSRAAGVSDVTLSVRRGEILGVAGLVGSGRTELAETIFGLRPIDAGEVRLNGAPVRIHSPADAIRLGIAYLPEDRAHHGVVAEFSIAANASLARLDAVSRYGVIDRQTERRLAEGHVDRLRIKAPSAMAPVTALSGGNQQKVAFARWLSIEPRVLILDEPTQGVDVGAKGEIHAIIGALSEQGVAIIMISSELPEIIGMSDRIAVMRRGTIAGVLIREQATPAQILAMALGHDEVSAERPS